MMKILLLGGIGEARQLAIDLSHHISNAQLKSELILSLSGQVRVAKITCGIRLGEFGGITGLIEYLQVENISLILDVTHPYAENISNHAYAASKVCNIPLWAYRRLPWKQEAGDRWVDIENSGTLGQSLFCYKRPLFTIGRSALDYLQYKTESQHWYVRYAADIDSDITVTQNDVTLIKSIGPFEARKEKELFDRYEIDVLIAKNSGGGAVQAKIQLARERRLPVLMLTRPDKPSVMAEFNDVNEMKLKLVQYINSV